MRTPQAKRKSTGPPKYLVKSGKKRHQRLRIWHTSLVKVVTSDVVLQSYDAFKKACPDWFPSTKNNHELAKQWLLTEDNERTYINAIHLCRFLDKSTALLTDADVYHGELVKIREIPNILHLDDGIAPTKKYEGQWSNEGKLSEWAEVDTSTFEHGLSTRVLADARKCGQEGTTFPAGALKHSPKRGEQTNTKPGLQHLVPFQFKKNNCVGAAVLNSGVLTPEESSKFQKKMKPFMFLTDLGPILQSVSKDVRIFRKNIPKKIDDFMTCNKGTNIFTGKPVEDTFNLTAGFDGITVPIATKMTYTLLDIDDGHLTLLNADGETKDGDVMLSKPHNVDEDDSAWDPMGMEVVKRFGDGEALKITILAIMGSELLVAVSRDRDLE